MLLVDAMIEPRDIDGTISLAVGHDATASTNKSFSFSFNSSMCMILLSQLHPAVNSQNQIFGPISFNF